VSAFNSVTLAIELPWAKHLGEKHLPGMQSAGPGTRLEPRLDPDSTLKPDSQPIDRVDEAAYHHDIAYATFQMQKRAITLIELC
jgi:hypothetical protein